MLHRRSRPSRAAKISDRTARRAVGRSRISFYYDLSCGMPGAGCRDPAQGALAGRAACRSSPVELVLRRRSTTKACPKFRARRVRWLFAEHRPDLARAGRATGSSPATARMACGRCRCCARHRLNRHPDPGCSMKPSSCPTRTASARCRRYHEAFIPPSVMAMRWRDAEPRRVTSPARARTRIYRRQFELARAGVDADELSDHHVPMRKLHQTFYGDELPDGLARPDPTTMKHEPRPDRPMSSSRRLTEACSCAMPVGRAGVSTATIERTCSTIRDFRRPAAVPRIFPRRHRPAAWAPRTRPAGLGSSRC